MPLERAPPPWLPRAPKIFNYIYIISPNGSTSILIHMIQHLSPCLLSHHLLFFPFIFIILTLLCL
jgi:hypothetical protein